MMRDIPLLSTMLIKFFICNAVGTPPFALVSMPINFPCIHATMSGTPDEPYPCVAGIKKYNLCFASRALTLAFTLASGVAIHLASRYLITASASKYKRSNSSEDCRASRHDLSIEPTSDRRRSFSLARAFVTLPIVSV